MSDLKKAVLKVAQSNPEFAQALTAELSKQAGNSGPIQRSMDKDYRQAQRWAEEMTHSSLGSDALQIAHKSIPQDVRDAKKEIDNLAKGRPDFGALAEAIDSLIWNQATIEAM